MMECASPKEGETPLPPNQNVPGCTATASLRRLLPTQEGFVGSSELDATHHHTAVSCGSHQPASICTGRYTAWGSALCLVGLCRCTAEAPWALEVEPRQSAQQEQPDMLINDINCHLHPAQPHALHWMCRCHMSRATTTGFGKSQGPILGLCERRPLQQTAGLSSGREAFDFASQALASQALVTRC